jgi:hypothetical protein
MIAQSKRMLENCAIHHASTCPSDLNALLPTRVINVNSDQNREGLSLHISTPDERAHYAALS